MPEEFVLPGLPEEILAEITPEQVIADPGLWLDLKEQLTENNQTLWALLWGAGVWAAFNSGEKRASEEIGAEWVPELSLPRSKQYFLEHGLQFVTNMTEVDIAHLKNLIRENWGKNEREFKKNIEASKICAPSRLALIHRTEIHASHEGGAFRFALDNGAQWKQWHATGDKRTREAHMLLNGQVRPITQPFNNSEMVPSSPNCRCWLEYFTESPYAQGVSPHQIAPFIPPTAVT